MSTVPPSFPPQPPSPEPPLDPTIIAPPASPVDPILVLVIAFFFWGIAYFVYGQWQKGVGSLLLCLALLVVSIITCGIGAVLFTPLWVLTILDAYMQAKLLKDGSRIRQWTFFTQAA